MSKGSCSAVLWSCLHQASASMQSQCCNDTSDIGSIKTIETNRGTLEGVATHSEVISSQLWLCIDTDAWCKRALTCLWPRTHCETKWRSLLYLRRHTCHSCHTLWTGWFIFHPLSNEIFSRTTLTLDLDWLLLWDYPEPQTWGAWFRLISKKICNKNTHLQTDLQSAYHNIKLLKRNQGVDSHCKNNWSTPGFHCQSPLHNIRFISASNPHRSTVFNSSSRFPRPNNSRKSIYICVWILWLIGCFERRDSAVSVTKHDSLFGWTSDVFDLQVTLTPRFHLPVT